MDNTESKYIQQGDVILRKCGISGVFEKEWADIPESAEPIDSNLVLKGQTNSHAVYDGAFVMYFDEATNTRFIQVLEPTTLDHVKDLVSMERAEHHAQVIPPGEYFIDQLNEYDHLLEESRKLVD